MADCGHQKKMIFNRSEPWVNFLMHVFCLFWVLPVPCVFLMAFPCAVISRGVKAASFETRSILFREIHIYTPKSISCTLQKAEIHCSSIWYVFSLTPGKRSIPWSLVDVRSNGRCQAFTDDIYDTPCFLDLTYFPFDEQICDMSVANKVTTMQRKFLKDSFLNFLFKQPPQALLKRIICLPVCNMTPCMSIQERHDFLCAFFLQYLQCTKHKLLSFFATFQIKTFWLKIEFKFDLNSLKNPSVVEVLYQAAQPFVGFVGKRSHENSAWQVTSTKCLADTRLSSIDSVVTFTFYMERKPGHFMSSLFVSYMVGSPQCSEKSWNWCCVYQWSPMYMKATMFT